MTSWEPNKKYLLMIVEAINILCPVKQMRLSINVPGWITRESMEAIATKRELFKVAMIVYSGIERDWNAFKKQRITVGKMLTKAKLNLIVSALEENKKDPRRFCRFLNVDLGLSEKISGNNQTFSRVKNDKGQILEGNEACNHMSEYYATVKYLCLVMFGMSIRSLEKDLWNVLI